MKQGDLVYFSDRGNAMFLIKDNIKNRYSSQSGLLPEYEQYGILLEYINSEFGFFAFIIFIYKIKELLKIDNDNLRSNLI